jgi:hypothetical protein
MSALVDVNTGLFTLNTATKFQRWILIVRSPLNASLRYKIWPPEIHLDYLMLG